MVENINLNYLLVLPHLVVHLVLIHQEDLEFPVLLVNLVFL